MIFDNELFIMNKFSREENKLVSNVSQQVSKFPLDKLNDYIYVDILFRNWSSIPEFRFEHSNFPCSHSISWQMKRKLVRYLYPLYDKKRKKQNR